MIEQIFEERNASTLQTRLRDVIRAQNDFVKKQNDLRKVIKPSSDEQKLHRDYLKYHLQKNFYD